jgi:cell division protein FtsN
MEANKPRAKDPNPVVSMGWIMNPDAQTIYVPRETKEIVYKVYLGTHPDSLPPDLIEKFLTVDDITSKKNSEGLNDYTAGSYKLKEEAEKRREELVAKGITEAKVQAYDKDGNIVDESTVSSSSSPVATTREPAKSTVPEGNPNEVTYRIQLGAFSSTVSPDEFKDVGETYTEPGPNGLTRYITGNFKSYGEAATFRDEIKARRTDGAYVTAFVVAYKGKERVNLSEVIPSMQMIEKNRQVITQSLQKAEDETVTFKIQIGVFKNDVPSDHMGIFLTLRKVERETTADGLTRYTAGGAFNDLKSAEAYKEEIASKGINDAFVIAYIGKKQVSVAEAVEFLRKQ